MMSGPPLLITPPAMTATEQPRQTLRLKLKPKAPTTGYVENNSHGGGQAPVVLDEYPDRPDSRPGTGAPT